jgi:molybdopterin synthase sulfur carrier subunit
VVDLQIEEATVITVHAKLFATLRRHYPHLGIGEPMPVKLPAGAKVGDLIARLDLPADQVKIVFVNNVIQGLEHPLADGDQVGIFPPVGGG